MKESLRGLLVLTAALTFTVLCASQAAGSAEDSPLVFKPAALEQPAALPGEPGGPAVERILVVPRPIEPGEPVVEPTVEAVADLESKFNDYTWGYTFISAGGKEGFGIQSLSTQDRWYDLWANPHWMGESCHVRGGLGFNIHWWEGPKSPVIDGAPDLPPRVYDLFLDFAWHQAWSELFHTELAIMPGLFTDFRVTPPDAFRIRGRALGFLRPWEGVQIVGGLEYLDWNTIKALPVGGVIWQPGDGLVFRLVFPYPKAACRLATRNSHELWGYVAGQYSGGAWDFKTADGSSDSVQYDDLRAVLGLEWVSCSGVVAFAEAGYVFERRLRFEGVTPAFDPTNTVLVRVGFGY